MAGAATGKYLPHDEAFLKKVFSQFDKDENGHLDIEEAAAALIFLGSKLKPEDIDTDGDGKVSLEEFLIFSQLTGKHTHPIFKAARTNTDISGASKTGISIFSGDAQNNPAFMEQAAKSWRKLAAARDYDEKELERVFNAVDRSGDGTLDHGEVRLAIKSVAPQITEMDITIMLKTSDTDGDSKITFEEWKKLMLHGADQDIDYSSGVFSEQQRYGDRDMHVGLKDRRREGRR